MTKIKYADKKIRQYMDKNLKNIEIEVIEEIILKIASYYEVFKPVIVDCDVDYDGLNIFLLNKRNDEKGYTISFDFDETLLVNVRRENQTSYDVFEVIENEIFLYEKVYENKKNKVIITKIFPCSNDDLEFQYYYFNNYLNSKIILNIPKTKIIAEGIFIKSLLQEENVTDITKLYEVISRIVKDSNIRIINKTNNSFTEKLIVDNGTLTEYRRYIKRNDGFELVEFSNGNLWITKKERVATNEMVDEIKKLIK